MIVYCNLILIFVHRVFNAFMPINAPINAAPGRGRGLGVGNTRGNAMLAPPGELRCRVQPGVIPTPLCDNGNALAPLAPGGVAPPPPGGKNPPGLRPLINGSQVPSLFVSSMVYSAEYTLRSDTRSTDVCLGGGSTSPGLHRPPNQPTKLLMDDSARNGRMVPQCREVNPFRDFIKIPRPLKVTL